ncbi:MAG: hypothetical protein ACRC8Y_03055 [Chroococcales cyanobacterium]
MVFSVGFNRRSGDHARATTRGGFIPRRLLQQVQDVGCPPYFSTDI